MQTALKPSFLSVEDYLSGEEFSDIRHEYVAGAVYAMAGGSDAHNTIAGNLFAALHSHLGGSKCRVFFADVKTRIRVADIFYYPDLMVTCDPRDTATHFKEFPSLIVEVISETTERIDRHEKLLNYTQLESLKEYVLIAQDRVEVTLFRRSQNWKPELLRDPDQELRLDSLDFKTRLETIYERVAIDGG